MRNPRSTPDLTSVNVLADLHEVVVHGPTDALRFFVPVRPHKDDASVPPVTWLAERPSYLYISSSFVSASVSLSVPSVRQDLADGVMNLDRVQRIDVRFCGVVEGL
jgi:hypothetical protein